LIAVGALAAAVLINMRGVASTGKGEVITTATLVGLLLVYTGLVIMDPGFQFAADEFILHLPTQAFPVLAGVALIFTTYIGYEYIASVAEEVKEPAKNIPRALFITIGITTVLFTVVSFVTVNIVPIAELSRSEAPFLLIAEHIGTVGWVVVLPAAILATAGSLLAATLVASRRLYALSEQGFFQEVFSSLNRNDVPWRAVMAVATLAVFLILTDSVAFVAYMGNAVYLVSLIVIALSLVRFRRQRPYLARPFRIPMFPWLPIGMALLATLILVMVGPVSLLATALWALLGYFVYLFTRLTYRRLYWATWGAVLFLFVFAATGFHYLV
jgi:amino acid transporter